MITITSQHRVNIVNQVFVYTIFTSYTSWWWQYRVYIGFMYPTKSILFCLQRSNRIHCDVDNNVFTSFIRQSNIYAIFQVYTFVFTLFTSWIWHYCVYIIYIVNIFIKLYTKSINLFCIFNIVYIRMFKILCLHPSQ